MNTVGPAISSIISLIFAIAVLDQYLARRKAYQLVWALGIFMYFISTGSEFLTEINGLNATVYRLWYLFGAVLVAAYLGMGSIYLLASRRTAHIVMTILGIASIYAVLRVSIADLDFSLLPTSGPLLSGEALPTSVRLMTPFFNVFGAVALVGGAIYSARIFWRRRIMRHRVLSNALIAIGAILPAAAGTIARFGQFNLLYLLELLGIVLIFVGFLRSSEIFGLPRVPLIHGFRR